LATERRRKEVRAMDQDSTEREAANSRYLVQVTRKELVELFAAVQAAKNVTIDSDGLAFRKSLLAKLAQSQENGPVPICEIHQIPMVRMKGKHGPFWSCHQKDDDGNWCDYRPTQG